MAQYGRQTKHSHDKETRIDETGNDEGLAEFEQGERSKAVYGQWRVDKRPISVPDITSFEIIPRRLVKNFQVVPGSCFKEHRRQVAPIGEVKYRQITEAA